MEWVELIEPKTKQLIYTNLVTGECSWDPPIHGNFLPSTRTNWWELYDLKSGCFYYYHAESGVTTWQKPAANDKTLIVPLAKLQILKGIHGSTKSVPTNDMFVTTNNSTNMSPFLDNVRKVQNHHENSSPKMSSLLVSNDLYGLKDTKMCAVESDESDVGAWSCEEENNSSDSRSTHSSVTNHFTDDILEDSEVACYPPPSAAADGRNGGELSGMRTTLAPDDVLINKASVELRLMCTNENSIDSANTDNCNATKSVSVMPRLSSIPSAIHKDVEIVDESSASFDRRNHPTKTSTATTNHHVGQANSEDSGVGTGDGRVINNNKSSPLLPVSVSSTVSSNVSNQDSGTGESNPLLHGIIDSGGGGSGTTNRRQRIFPRTNPSFIYPRLTQPREGGGGTLLQPAMSLRKSRDTTSSSINHHHLYDAANSSIGCNDFNSSHPLTASPATATTYGSLNFRAPNKPCPPRLSALHQSFWLDKVPPPAQTLLPTENNPIYDCPPPPIPIVSQSPRPLPLPPKLTSIESIKPPVNLNSPILTLATMDGGAESQNTPPLFTLNAPQLSSNTSSSSPSQPSPPPPPLSSSSSITTTTTAPAIPQRQSFNLKKMTVGSPTSSNVVTRDSSSAAAAADHVVITTNPPPSMPPIFLPSPPPPLPLLFTSASNCSNSGSTTSFKTSTATATIITSSTPPTPSDSATASPAAPISSSYTTTTTTDSEQNAAHASPSSINNNPIQEDAYSLGFPEFPGWPEHLFRKCYSVAKATTWSKNIIQHPLLNSTEKSLKKLACESFKLIQKYMGNRKSRYSLPDLALSIVQRALTNAGLRDEIYMQLCKQTCQNPSLKSVYSGLQLMCICLQFFSPSIAFRDHLEAYLRHHVTHLDCSSSPSLVNNNFDNVTATTAMTMDDSSSSSSSLTRRLGSFNNNNSTNDNNSTSSLIACGNLRAGVLASIGLHQISLQARVALRRLARITSISATHNTKPLIVSMQELENAKNSILNPTLFESSIAEQMAMQKHAFPDLQVPWLFVLLSRELLRLNAPRIEGIFRVPADHCQVMRVRGVIENLHKSLCSSASSSLSNIKSQWTTQSTGHHHPHYSQHPSSSSSSSHHQQQHDRNSLQSFTSSSLDLLMEHYSYVFHNEDVHTLAGLLKLWLREMAEPLIPENLYSNCLSACEDAKTACHLVQHSLIHPNRSLLLALVYFLQIFSLSSNSSLSRMDAGNLAMVIAPNILRTPSNVDPRRLVDEARLQTLFLKTLIHGLTPPPPPPTTTTTTTTSASSSTTSSSTIGSGEPHHHSSSSTAPNPPTPYDGYAQYCGQTQMPRDISFY